MFLAFSNIVVRVVHCFLKKRNKKWKKKFNVPLWFEFPVRFFFSFSLVHWIFCSALWNHKLVLIILPNCLLYFHFLPQRTNDTITQNEKAQKMRWFMISKATKVPDCVCVCVWPTTKTSWQVKGLVLLLRDPRALTESRGGLGERGREERRASC